MDNIEVHISTYSDTRADDSDVESRGGRKVAKFGRYFHKALKAKIRGRLEKIKDLGEIGHFTVDTGEVNYEMRGTSYWRIIDVVNKEGKRFKVERYYDRFGKITDE